MQERHHIKTHPGEPKAPEILDHDAEHLEPGGSTQSEDINIPIVAISVAFFASGLLVIIVLLQAWFYNAQKAEVLAKLQPQGSPNTFLGQVTTPQQQLLDDKKGGNQTAIEKAMSDTVAAYQNRK